MARAPGSGTVETATTDTHYAYDALGRLDAVAMARRNGAPVDADPNTSGDQPEVTDYVYDLLGNLDQVRLPTIAGGDNRVISDYDYDSLNRLDLLREFKDLNDNQVYDSAVDMLLAEYDYDLAADGRRSGVTEKVLVDSTLQETRIDWLYDDLGRLGREVYDGYGTDLDFVADYVHDLASNRQEKKVDKQPSAADMTAYRSGGTMTNVDELFSSDYDANDRLLTEAKDVAGGTEDDRYTVYAYGTGNAGTQQTGKTVHEGLDDTGDVVEQTDYAYNLQGRMSQASVDADGDGAGAAVVTDYAYDANGIRISQTEDGVKTVYLYDSQNPTGYAQILEEKDASLAVTKTYTLGHDVIAQQAPAIQSGGTLFLLYDGHGSTRGLVDATGQPLSNQVYRYDAFGNRLDASVALTSLLYSGEQTDLTGLQYLRARYYNPNTGRFNTLDPFFGNLNDPLSLHKYLYCHGDSINGTDPTGQFFPLVPIAIGAGIGLGAFGIAKLFGYSWFESAAIGVSMGAGSGVLGAAFLGASSVANFALGASGTTLFAGGAFFAGLNVNETYYDPVKAERLNVAFMKDVRLVDHSALSALRKLLKIASTTRPRTNDPFSVMMVAIGMSENRVCLDWTVSVSHFPHIWI